MRTLTAKPVEVDTFLETAREQFQFGLDFDQVDRTDAEVDNVFANASDTDKLQWDAIPRQSRESNHRPVLQWNRIPTYVQQVVNEGRQNKPAIKISVADGGTKEDAEYYQSRIRHIEYESNADIAYDTSRDQQVTSGRGHIRVTTEFVPGTFNQRIRIERIENQFSVVYDPAAMRYDRSDGEWCFVISRISKAEHERRYGKATTLSSTDFTQLWMDYPQWIGVGDHSDLIQIAEYWVKEYKKRTLVELESGVTAWKDELGEEVYATLKANRRILQERDEQDATVMRYIINGCEILAKGKWLGSTIPIVPVWGREAVVAGIRRTYSLIRQAKDPQRLVNLYVSNIAEQIAMMPKAPYEAPVGSIAANHEDAWRDAGMTAKAVLYYKQYDEANNKLDRPSRIVNEPPIQALSIGLQQSIDAIKASMGIFDASLGARSNETSGVAIERRKKSAEIVNFHFPDNEARSRKSVGEILLELIPLLDKPGMRVPVRSEDGKTEVVPIGEEYTNSKGQTVTHNPKNGNYGVTVSTGPTFDSARQEEHERLVAMVEAAPELIAVIGDQVIRTSDFPGSDQIADRMERWIDAKTPGLIEEKGKDEAPIPPKVQQQMVMMQQELQTTREFAQSLHQKLETNQPALDNAVKLKQMDIDIKREELAVNNTVKMAVEELKLGVTADMETFRQELELLKVQAGLSAENQAQQADHQQQEKMADKSHAQALEQGEQGHAQTLETQEQAAELAPKPEAE